ncbi:odorant receptor 10-like [Megachile rotundata]|uniref:odorant receptor 10-like n=1 Tax=Megachile rotundata TaxID=143995 RepID=UPI000258F2EA|nr:PREDICTED: odorant receptor Or2-like [Megachile rotundata]
MGKPSENTIDYYIQPNKILCSIYGLWPTDEERTTSKQVLAVVHLVISVIIVCSVFVPEVIILTTKWRDLSILAGAGTLTLTMTQFLFKTIYLTTKRDTAHRLLVELRSLWVTTDDPVERQSYEVFAYWGRISTIGFFMSAVGSTSLFLVTATLDCFEDVENSNRTNRHLPYDVWQELDFLKSPEFEVIYACQILATLNACCAVCGMDGMCWTTILYLSGQFRLITTWLNNIGVEMNYKPHPKDCSVKVAADLVKCIRHHQRLSKVVKDVNSLLIPIIFIQLLTSGVQICLSGFAVLSNNGGDNLLKFSCFLSSVLVQLVMYCWPGEILIQESQEVGYAAYLGVPWYQLPPAYRRQLMLIILKSQDGCSISALTFKSLGCHTLTSVFNTGSSYFALLRKMQDTSS